MWDIRRKKYHGLSKNADKYADAYEISVHYIGKDPTPMMEAVKAVKKTGKPVFLKLSPHPGIDPVMWAKKAIEAGADSISVINSFGRYWLWI